MKIKIKDNYIIATFLLLWYCYLNGLRRFFIPFSSVTVPALLVIVLFLVSRQKIRFANTWDKILCFIWITIVVLIVVDNASLKTTVISGGIIQMFVLVSFMLFSTFSDERWLFFWMKLTRIYALLHALATIVFYYNASLYNRFARLMFSGTALNDILRYYRKGWMSGLSAHFSTNGMILGIGVLFWIEYILDAIRTKSKKGRKFYVSIVATLAIVYALILSSKRSPLLAAVIAVAATMIIYRKKNVGKRILVLLVTCILIFAAYQYLSNYIPGLTTLVDKSEALEETSAGILNGRSGLWNLAIDMFKSNPIFGCGYGSYKIYATNRGAITTTAHNFYLQILAELGIVGFVLYVGAFCFGTTQALRGLQMVESCEKMENLPQIRMTMCVALEVQIFVLIYNMTSTALSYYYIMVPYFLACAATRFVRYKELINT